ncbi:MAG TPA: alginate export family protein [Nitrospirota bacterium]|nr:alginate export family protein [Nitrospirota bacterium]
MKKVLVALVILTMVCFGSLAFAAAEVSVGGSVQIRSRDFGNLRFENGDPSGTYADTQERIELDVNMKAGDDVKGKIALWNDFQDWGNIENPEGSGFGNSLSSNPGTDHFGFREAWLNFNLPVIPVNVTAGHQMLALGEGWFLRNKHFGDDAWVIANVTGNNVVAFVNIVASKAIATEADSAVDAYALLDVYKFNENNTAGIYLANVNARPGAGVVVPYPPLGSAVPEFTNVAGTDLYNLGLHYAGKIGPLDLHAELDLQTGHLENTNINTEPKFSGNQIVIQGDVPLDPVTFKFTLARGSGDKAAFCTNTYECPSVSNAANPNVQQFINFLDVDPHYTFLYEYKTITAAGARNTGFANTTAVSVGANVAVSKSVNIGLDLWYLMATEKDSTPLALATNDTQTSADVGAEADLSINWKLYDNLTWNWQLGYYKPGGAMRAPGIPDSTSTANAGSVGGTINPVYGVQGVLSLNF